MVQLGEWDSQHVEHRLTLTSLTTQYTVTAVTTGPAATLGVLYAAVTSSPPPSQIISAALLAARITALTVRWLLWSTEAAPTCQCRTSLLSSLTR